MATITPTVVTNGSVVVVTWTGVSTTTDTPTAYGPVNQGKGAVRAAVMFSGTFGGATAAMQGSIDNSVFATLTDLAGNAVSGTAAKMQEFSSSALYFNPSVSGGTGDNVNITLLLRN